MMNMPFAEFALKQAQKFPQLGVGIHLVLTLGKPLIDGALSYTCLLYTSNLLPSLLPFMILISLCLSLGLFQLLSYFIQFLF